MTAGTLRFSILLLATAALAGGPSNPEAGASGPETREDPAAVMGTFCPGPRVDLPPVCGAALEGPQISCTVPGDVQGGLRQPDFNVRQRASDLFSWQVLIGLNWPAKPGERGEPDRGRSISDPGPRVWETWKETSEVFRQKKGQPVAPAPWEAPEPIPQACRGAAKVLVRDLKVDDVQEAVVQPTFADGTRPGTLTDQRGRRVRYEIRINRKAFDYIVDNRLWDGRAQAKVKEVQFPDGAMLTKAAWREVGADESSRFHSIEACLCEDDAQGALSDCRRQAMGLVGFHVMSKTPSAPQWIWTTFEQEDNVVGRHGVAPSFFDPRCEGCETNRQGETGFPNQVTRLIPIPSRDPDCSKPRQAVDNVARLNREMSAALARAATVFSRYELVGTQWPFPADGLDQPATVFGVEPALLGNTTLETYIQESSSCMGCHSIARTDSRERWISADFTFTLNDAFPNPDPDATSPPPDSPVQVAGEIGPPLEPKTLWDREHWSAVQQGFLLSVETFERLPELVGNRLHCGSCHLEAGGDPNASWWVGMTFKYAYPQTPKLFDRINRCFTNSMNGTAPCDPDVPSGPRSCTEDPVQTALITYMRWLDEQWQAANVALPPTGFPPLAPGRGQVERGARVFLQKCAFCHGVNGEGRFLSNTYYRPALWGPDSFNEDAGLATAATLAPFLKANMPFRAGGALTDQEAWDLACWVDFHKRPGKTSTGADPESCQGP